jgi:dTDP-4-dehydrorhamnose reductase
MKVLVTGTNGQVARSLAERAAAHEGVSVACLGRPGLDLMDSSSVDRAIGAANADIVVSAAAYTAVDKAEEEPGIAHAVNALGAEAVARAAAMDGIPVIHVSTDYVFSGDSEIPYAEDDTPDPRSVYGKTKLEGEHRVAAANPRHLILRTAWVYSPFGKNFVKTMLRLAAERDEIAVVADQWGNPTSALDIADAILLLAKRVPDLAGPVPWGTYHLAGTGATSWAGCAGEVMQASAALGGPSARIRPIPAAEFPTRARRPANSRLSTQKLADALGWRAPHWRESVRKTVVRLSCQTPETAAPREQ